MGLGKLLNRSTQYVATDLDTGASQTFTILDNIAPDWGGYNYRGGMKIPGAWRAATLVSDLLGSIPWDAFRKYGNKPVEKLTPRPHLLEQPAPPDSSMTTFSSWILDLLWHGNLVGLIATRDSFGFPTSVYPVPADIVGVRRVGPGSGGYLPIGEIEYSVGQLRNLTSHDVIHIKGPCAPGALRGMGILEMHLETLALAREQINQAGSVSKHGVPTGVISSSNSTLTQPQATKLKENWLKSQEQRTVAVLRSTETFTPLSWNPEQMQMIEGRKMTLVDTANMFGLDASWLNASQSSRTYSNIEQEAINLIKFALGGHIARFEQGLSLCFPRGTRVRGDLDALLRPDTLARYQAYEIALRNRILTEDEVREREDLPPLPPREEPRREIPAQFEPESESESDQEEGSNDGAA